MPSDFSIRATDLASCFPTGDFTTQLRNPRQASLQRRPIAKPDEQITVGATGGRERSSLIAKDDPLFDTRFSSEEGCREYLFKLRWPEGFFFRCSVRKSWPSRGILRVCAGCGYQASVTAGTIFQDTRTPLRLCFQAMWWMTTEKNGASALGPQRVLGLKQSNGLDLAAPVTECDGSTGARSVDRTGGS